MECELHSEFPGAKIIGEDTEGYCTCPKPRRPFKVVCYQAHIDIVDAQGCTVAAVADQGSVQETLRVAHLLAEGGERK